MLACSKLYRNGVLEVGISVSLIGYHIYVDYDGNMLTIISTYDR